VSQRDLEELAKSLLARATRGDLAAAALVLQYTIGKPSEAVDPDDVDRDEWQRLRESAVTPNDVVLLMHRLRASDFCDIAHGTWPLFAKTIIRTMADALRNPQYRSQVPSEPGSLDPNAMPTSPQ
jgi:hypothetical protein